MAQRRFASESDTSQPWLGPGVSRWDPQSTSQETPGRFNEFIKCQKQDCWCRHVEMCYPTDGLQFWKRTVRVFHTRTCDCGNTWVSPEWTWTSAWNDDWTGDWRAGSHADSSVCIIAKGTAELEMALIPGFSTVVALADDTLTGYPKAQHPNEELQECGWSEHHKAWRREEASLKLWWFAYA